MRLVPVFEIFIMATYASSIFSLIPVIFVLIFSIKIAKYYLKTQREIVRFLAIFNSPIVTGFTSVINGLPTIRAFKCEE